MQGQWASGLKNLGKWPFKIKVLFKSLLLNRKHRTRESEIYYIPGLHVPLELLLEHINKVMKLNT